MKNLEIPTYNVFLLINRSSLKNKVHYRINNNRKYILYYIILIFFKNINNKVPFVIKITTIK